MDKFPRWPNPVYDVAWHPSQHMIAVASYGKGQQVCPINLDVCTICVCVQILLFTTELEQHVERPPIRSTLLNSDASSAIDQQQALRMRNATTKRDAAKKRYFDEYMSVIYASEQ